MEFKKQIIDYLVASVVLLLSGCATIVNDPNIPLVVSFSDGSAGKCTFKNKRGVWSSEIPTTAVYIRRSDDALVYECSTKDGREVTGSIRSEIEGEKMAASVIFWDLGITDAITDKHRTYQGNIVIPVPPPVPVRAVAPEPEPKLPVLETAVPEPQLEDKIMLRKTDDIISEEKKEWAGERIIITVDRVERTDSFPERLRDPDYTYHPPSKGNDYAFIHITVVEKMDLRINASEYRLTESQLVDERGETHQCGVVQCNITIPEKKVCYLVFEIPKDSTPVQLKYHYQYREEPPKPQEIIIGEIDVDL